MISSIGRVGVLAAGAALFLVACGSDSDPEESATTPVDTSVEADDDLFTQVEDGGEATEADATTSTTEAADPEAGSTTVATDAPSAETTTAPAEDAGGADDADAATGGGGSGGSSDDAQASLDDAGVDLDLDDLEDDLADFNTGEGGGVITVDGVAYEFAGDFCIASNTDFLIEGPGVTANGLPFWGSISASSEFDFDGDGQPDETLDILVEVGKDEMFGSGVDDQPDLSASKLNSSAMQLGEDIEYTIDGTTISGSGPIEDFNSVLAPLGETLPMTFEGSCN